MWPVALNFSTDQRPQEGVRPVVRRLDQEGSRIDRAMSISTWDATAGTRPSRYCLMARGAITGG